MQYTVQSVGTRTIRDYRKKQGNMGPYRDFPPFHTLNFFNLRKNYQFWVQAARAGVETTEGN